MSTTDYVIESVGETTTRHPLLAGLRTGAWLDAQTFAPLSYAVDGIIPEGSSLLVGPPKIGKSWFVLSAALGVAAGGYALGVIPVQARPVLYLALEDGDRRLQDRCRILLDGGPIPPAFHYMTTLEPGTAIATIAAWLSEHAAAAPLVILDTLGKVMPPAQPGESAYQRDYRIGSALKQLADRYAGCSVLVNHHDRKAGSEDFVDSVSGTHGLAGAADTIIVLTRQRHETSGLLKVTGRDVAEGEYALTYKDGAVWQLDGRSLEAAAQMAVQVRSTAGVGDRMADVIAYVAHHPEGIGPTAVGQALGMDAKTAGTYLGRAAEAGRLHKQGRGLYTPVGSVESVESTNRDQTNPTHPTVSTPPLDEHDEAISLLTDELGATLDGDAA